MSRQYMQSAAGCAPAPRHERHSALSTQHSALSTQHSALSFGRLIPESFVAAALFWRALPGIALIFLLVGCATPGQYYEETKSVDVTGAYQLTDRESFETIDLSNLLCQYAPQGDPKKCSYTDSSANINGIPTVAASTSATTQKQLDTALHYYNGQIQQASDPQQKKSSRNALQERLLAASAQRCNAYKGNLQRTFSRTNFGLGVFATIAGTAGALVNSASAASNWAGLSAISSGSRAEFNQDFMSNLAAYVIVDGIDKRRQTVYEQIQTKGQARDYEAYPVEAAIKDALYYHGQCSVIAGFQEASDSIKYASDPGVNTAINAMAKIHAANLMMRGDEKSPEVILAAVSKITSTTAQVAGTALEGSKGMDAVLDDFPAQVAHIEATKTFLKKAVDDLATKTKAKELSVSGLDKPFVAPDTGFRAELHEKCITKISGYATAESIALTQAWLEKDAAKKDVLLAEAGLKRAKRNEIVIATKKLADDYRTQAQKAINNWKDLLDKIKNADGKDFNTLKESLAENNLPTLDSVQVSALKDPLCKP